MRKSEIAEDIYVGVIVRLLKGWIQNYDNVEGKPLQEWWHPYRTENEIEPMSDAEFGIVTKAYDEIRKHVMEGINE